MKPLSCGQVMNLFWAFTVSKAATNIFVHVSLCVCLSVSVAQSPGSEIAESIKNVEPCWTWQYIPVIPGIWTEAGGLQDRA